jgi:hypothetical protein
MTVRDFLELATDLFGIRIRIFDFNTEDIIFDSDKLDEYDDPVSEVAFSDIGDYEVCSYDLYLHNGIINLELNIDYESEEEDE